MPEPNIHETAGVSAASESCDESAKDRFGAYLSHEFTRRLLEHMYRSKISALQKNGDSREMIG
jgi:hypothetical protein